MNLFKFVFNALRFTGVFGLGLDMGGGGGGGGGGSPAPTTQTVQQSNIPEYARPYVESMLGATQQQLFNVGPSGELTSVKGYTPYSADPSQYIAPFSPLQQQAQAGAAGMQVPGQFGTASNIAQSAAMGSLGAGPDAAKLMGGALGYGGAGAQAGFGFGQQATNPAAVQAFMNPYVQASLQPQLAQLAQQTGMQGAAQQAAATSAGAFGGSRSALQNALVQQAGNLAAQQTIGQGYNQAYQQAMQGMQTASQLGMQGAGLGLQGIGQAVGAGQYGLAGLGQAGAQAANLADIGGKQLTAQQGIVGLQAQMGAQQQQQQQNIINQAIQNYAMQQQYPLQSLAFLNAQLRGLPLQTMTTQGYAAAPSLGSQLTGLGVAGLGAYKAMQ